MIEEGVAGRPMRLVVVVSHPIQYFAPLYRRLAAEPGVHLTVLFASRVGLDVRRDEFMGVDMAWKTDLTSGYAHRFLPGAETVRRARFFDLNNPGVGRALAAEKPDVILLHGYAAITNLKTLAWAAARGVPVVMISDSTIDSSGADAGHLLRRAIKRLIFRRFAAFLTMGDRGETYLAGYGVERERMFRAPTMIDALFWRAREGRAARRGAMRIELGLAEDNVALLWVGKIYSGKRLGDVIAALAPLDRRIKLIVAGNGVDRQAMEATAKEAGIDARFLGFVNLDRLPDLYAATDALVHSAEVEQYGMVILEAAVLGLPLIVSDRIGAVGPTSIAQPDVNALVYPCGDVEALRAAIRCLTEGGALRRRLGQNSLEISETHSGAESMKGVIAACRYVLGHT